MFLNPKDRCLEIITKKRLESMQSRNVKISIMITGATSFLILQAGAYLSTNDIGFTMVEHFIAADISVRGYMGSTFLNEITLSNYLDEQIELDNAVRAYSFTGLNLDNICDLQKCTHLGTGSAAAGKNQDDENLQINLFSVDENYLDTVDDRFYKPTEVSNSIRYTASDTFWSKPDAVRALYAYESYSRSSKDEFGLVNSLEETESE